MEEKRDNKNLKKYRIVSSDKEFYVIDLECLKKKEKEKNKRKK